MMRAKVPWVIAAVTVTALVLPSVALATPLRMDYLYTDIGGVYEYEFWLTLDNNDSTWSPGHGWGWLIWGDKMSNPSDIADFVGDASDLPVGPWTYYTSSGGYHNGPTFGYVLDCWVPTAVGDTLYWSGTSATALDPPDMLWSSIYTCGGAAVTEWNQANWIPEPGTLSLLAFGGLALVARRRA
jgi:hypothetical protein